VRFWRMPLSGPHRAKLAISGSRHLRRPHALASVTAPPPGAHRCAARRGVWALCLILEHWQAVEKMGGGPKVLFVVPHWQGRVQWPGVEHPPSHWRGWGHIEVSHRMSSESSTQLSNRQSLSCAKGPFVPHAHEHVGRQLLRFGLSMFVDHGSLAHAPHVTSHCGKHCGKTTVPIKYRSSSRGSTDRAGTDLHAFQAPSNLKGRPLERAFI
jgi:hypothetical protein